MAIGAGNLAPLPDLRQPQPPLQHAVLGERRGHVGSRRCVGGMQVIPDWPVSPDREVGGLAAGGGGESVVLAVHVREQLPQRPLLARRWQAELIVADLSDDSDSRSHGPPVQLPDVHHDLLSSAEGGAGPPAGGGGPQAALAWPSESWLAAGGAGLAEGGAGLAAGGGGPQAALAWPSESWLAAGGAGLAAGGAGLAANGAGGPPTVWWQLAVPGPPTVLVGRGRRLVIVAAWISTFPSARPAACSMARHARTVPSAWTSGSMSAGTGSSGRRSPGWPPAGTVAWCGR